MNDQHPETGYTHVMYALHALAGFIGITSGATVIGAFVFGLPSILAVFMNYARRDRVRGSWLESHFLWQIRTFWTAVVLGIALFCIALVLGAFGTREPGCRRRSPAPSGAVGAGAGFGGAYGSP